MSKPTFAAIESNYSSTVHECPDIVPSENQCAVRVSRAVMNSGVPINAAEYEGNLCRHGYARGAQDLGAFLRRKWGVQDYGFTAPGSAPAQMNGIKSVILFMNIPTFRGQGHIDLWDGTTTKSGTYWNANPIWFWRLG
jgi:hypothetical protein